MKIDLKPKRVGRGLTALAVLASAASASLLTAPSAYAATLAGAATIRNGGNTANLNSGDSATAFSLQLPNLASCTGDSANSGYLVMGYMVPDAVNPGTLTFNGNGPIGAGNKPLWDTNGSRWTNKQTAPQDTPNGPGAVLDNGPFNYAVYAPGNIPAGVYNIGIACTLGGVVDNYWNVKKTFTTASAGTGGPAQVNWAYGVVPVAPVLNTLTPGNTTLTANYTSTASVPATTSYTVSATPTGGGTTVTASSASPTSTTVSGLTNYTQYNVTVTATNTTGTSPASNTLTGTPVANPHPPVTNLTATPGDSTMALAWTAPADVGTTAPTGYSVTNSPTGGNTPLTVTTTSASVTGLTNGTTYTFTVVATYSSNPAGTPATVTGTPLSATVLMQEITVTRPVGALVFTQVCGKNGAIAADTYGDPGFPSGSLPAIGAGGAGTAPTLGANGTGGPDGKFSQYPYPENADGTAAPTYPTHCGVALGNAKLVKSGSGAGQFFAASGVLNQVTVVETRDPDTGWSASGSMGTFSAGAGKTFSGSELGWNPIMSSSTPTFADSNGDNYTQLVNPGARVPANTLYTNGLSAGKALATAPARAGASPNFTGSLGIASLDARLKLLIPITAKSGNYTGTLTISAV